eukprot:g23383.t3
MTSPLGLCSGLEELLREAREATREATPGVPIPPDPPSSPRTESPPTPPPTPPRSTSYQTEKAPGGPSATTTVTPASTPTVSVESRVPVPPARRHVTAPRPSSARVSHAPGASRHTQRPRPVSARGCSSLAYLKGFHGQHPRTPRDLPSWSSRSTSLSEPAPSMPKGSAPVSRSSEVPEEHRKAPLPRFRRPSGYVRPADTARPTVPSPWRPDWLEKQLHAAVAMGDTEPEKETSQNVDSYMQQHQIQPFEMLTELFHVLPEDPYEYMTYHLASKRPEQNLIQSGVLWVLLPGSNPMSVDHWRLRRCWLTQLGVICVSNEAAEEYALEKGAIHRELEEDEAAKAFAFQVAVKPGPLAHKGDQAAGSRWVLQLAASSPERGLTRGLFPVVDREGEATRVVKRSEWFNALSAFSVDAQKPPDAEDPSAQSGRPQGIEEPGAQ